MLLLFFPSSPPQTTRHTFADPTHPKNIEHCQAFNFDRSIPRNPFKMSTAPPPRWWLSCCWLLLSMLLSFATSITLLPTSPSPLQPPRLVPGQYGPNYSFLTSRNGIQRPLSYDHVGAAAPMPGDAFRRHSQPMNDDNKQMSANSPITYENLLNTLVEQNQTNGGNFPPGLISTMYLNSQPYFGVDSPTASFLIPQALMDQYSAYYFANQSMAGAAKTGNVKMNNKNGLGRRIGELMTNSAEKASKAFKSFSKFNLFNEIKPSRLFGASSSPAAAVVSSPAQVEQLSTTNQMPFPVPVPGMSPWYPAAPLQMPQPAALSNWQQAPVTPTPSNVFYQQPVFVRAPEMSNAASGATSLSGAITSLVNPSSLAGGSDFYRNAKVVGNEGLASSLLNAVASSSSMLPIGGSTTVYHHYPSGSGSNGNAKANTGNGGGDLFAAPQTQYGLRVNPPKDFNDFDSSMEEGDNMNDGDNLGNGGSGRDELKMNQQGGGGGGGGGDRDNERNNANRDVDMGGNNEGNNGNGDNGNNGGGNDNWNNWNNNDEPYSDSNNPLDNAELYNHQSSFAYGGNSGQRYRPLSNNNRDNTHHHHHHHRQPVFFPKGNSEVRFPHSESSAAAVGRPRPLSSLPDIEDAESWYNTFFGSTIPAMNRIRNIQLSNSPPFATLNSAPSLQLNPAASTPLPLSISPEKFLPFSVYQDIPLPSRPQTFLPFAPRPYYGLYPSAYPSAAQLYRPAATPTPQTMMASDSTMRPVAMSNPYMQPNYYMRYRPYYAPALAYSGGYATPQTNTYASPYGYHRMAASPYPMLSAASQMYPIRMPFFNTAASNLGNHGHHHHHHHHSGHYATMAPSIPPPIFRYRFAPEMTNTRRMINITKRADIASSSNGNGEESKKDAKQILQNLLTKFVDQTKFIQPPALPQPEAMKNERSTVDPAPVIDQTNMATMYNAYQVLQDRFNQPAPEDIVHTPLTLSHNEKPSSSSSSSPSDKLTDYYYIGKDGATSTTTTTTTSLPNIDKAMIENTTTESIPATITTRNQIVARSIKPRDSYNPQGKPIEWREIQAEPGVVATHAETTSKPSARKTVDMFASKSSWTPLVRHTK